MNTESSLLKNQKNNFSNIDLDDLIETFSLKTDYALKIPSEALIQQQLTDLIYNPLTQKMLRASKEFIEQWNEQELIIKNISVILALIFSDDHPLNYSVFAERAIEAKINDYSLSGIVDLMIAKGRSQPKTPLFFIQEFKKGKNPTGDPFSQVLAAMLVAQELNKHCHPVYGSYIMGRFWYFVILHHNSYLQYQPLDSTNTEDLTEILCILQGIKTEIEIYYQY